MSKITQEQREHGLKLSLKFYSKINSTNTQKYTLLFVILGGWSVYLLYIIFMAK